LPSNKAIKYAASLDDSSNGDIFHEIAKWSIVENSSGING
jgi:hypothetical protein